MFVKNHKGTIKYVKTLATFYKKYGAYFSSPLSSQPRPLALGIGPWPFLLFYGPLPKLLFRGPHVSKLLFHGPELSKLLFHGLAGRKHFFYFCIFKVSNFAIKGIEDKKAINDMIKYDIF